jgi:hypothetical protein
MLALDVNPYQSPSAEVTLDERSRRTSRLLVLFGLYAGVMLGGAFGTIGLTAGSLIAAMLAPQLPLTMVSIAAISGFLAGGLTGGILGPLAALGLREQRSSGWVDFLTVALAGLLGAACVACGVLVLPSLAGIVVAGVCGVIGGIGLVRRVLRFAREQASFRGNWQPPSPVGRH